jgi:hypothetical protein
MALVRLHPLWEVEAQPAAVIGAALLGPVIIYVAAALGVAVLAPGPGRFVDGINAHHLAAQRAFPTLPIHHSS